MRSRAKLLIAAAALAVALPALAQESLLPPGFGNEATPTPTPNPTQQPEASSPASTSEGAARSSGGRAGGELGELVESGELTPEELIPLPPPVEIPDEARRDPRMAGAIDPVAWSLGAEPWGRAHGGFLSQLMRRQSTPLPSRWLHMALRNALLAAAPAPGLVNPADWVAERAWLLLRMGEADAARMLVSDVDVDDFTPKLTQVAVQSALATADPAGLCPLQERMSRTDPFIAPLTNAICAAIDGEAGSAASQIEQARRRGRVQGVDLILADKIVGAGESTGRAATVEWEPVQRLTAWRFGLATSTGMLPPERLMNDARPQLRAWAARAPLIAPADRLPFAIQAAGLGVFSSSALIDLQSLIYDATDASDLPETDAWQLRQAFAAPDPEQRLAAIRRLLRQAEDDEVRREGVRAMLSRAATLVVPDAELQQDAPDLIAAMLAGGFDRQAARWAGAVGQMDDEPGDRAWAMLALGTQSPAVDVSFGRIDSFIDRDNSPDKQRSKLLVAGLAGTGRINAETASSLNAQHELGLGATSVWTRLTERAGQRQQAGSAVLLAAIGMQSPTFSRVPAAQLYRGLTAMRLAGLGYSARMIAAEAMART